MRKVLSRQGKLLIALMTVLLLCMAASPVAAVVILQDDFTGTPGAALGSQWDTTNNGTISQPPATMIDSNGTCAQVGYCTYSPAAPGAGSSNGLAAANGGGPGAYGLKPTASVPARLTTKWGWRISGVYNSSNDGGYSSLDGKPVDYQGNIWFGLTDQVSGNITLGSGEILITNAISGHTNVYCVQIVDSAGTGIVRYSTGIGNYNGTSAAGQWVIDWYTNKVVVSYNGNTMVDTSTTVPFSNTFPGGTVVLPTTAMVPHFEVSACGEALIDSVKWESVVPVPPTAGVILQDDFTGTAGAAFGSQWDTTYNYYSAPPNTAIYESGTQARVGLASRPAPYYGNGLTNALGGGPGSYGFAPILNTLYGKLTLDFAWEMETYYHSGVPQDGSGSLAMGLFSKASGGRTAVDPELMIKEFNGHVGNFYYLSVIDANANISEYSTGIVNTNGNGAGEWIINWYASKVIVTYQGNVVIDTSTVAPGYNATSGKVAAIPSCKMAPHIETWGGGRALFDSVKWEAINDSPCAELRASGQVIGGDINHDCRVNFSDVTTMAQQWLSCTTPGGTGCTQQISAGHVIPAGVVTVDGNLNDWADAIWMPLTVNYATGEGTTCDVTNAVFALKWNAATGKIYAAVKLNDADQYFQTPVRSADWDTSDRLEIYTQGSAAGGTGYGTTFNVAQQYDIGFVSSGSNTLWAVWADDGGLPVGGSGESTPPGLEYAAVQNGNQLIYEIGIKQFETYGGFSGTTVASTLTAGKVVGLDLVIGSYEWCDTGFYGMLAENAMMGKFNDAGKFQKWTLIGGNNCGLWGYMTADLNQDCVVNIKDFAKMAQDWLRCNDPAGCN
jgi:hypothetical protein